MQTRHPGGVLGRGQRPFSRQLKDTGSGQKHAGRTVGVGAAERRHLGKYPPEKAHADVKYFYVALWRGAQGSAPNLIPLFSSCERCGRIRTLPARDVICQGAYRDSLRIQNDRIQLGACAFRWRHGRLFLLLVK